jgi:Tfp pilus assembly protein PilP
MKYKDIIIIILFVLTSVPTFADVDPFSRSFTKQSSGEQTSMSASPATGDASVHPMVRLSIDQYFVKGVVYSSKGSLAILSFPGGDDYFLYVGDPIGNDSHTLKTISTDIISVTKDDEDDIEIQVFNPVQTISGSDGQ